MMSRNRVIVIVFRVNLKIKRRPVSAGLLSVSKARLRFLRILNFVLNLIV